MQVPKTKFIFLQTSLSRASILTSKKFPVLTISQLLLYSQFFIAKIYLAHQIMYTKMRIYFPESFLLNISIQQMSKL